MLQQKMKEILQKEDDLQEIVQPLAFGEVCSLSREVGGQGLAVGRPEMHLGGGEDHPRGAFASTFGPFRSVNSEDFLQQNGFTEYDFMCPLAKTIGMMKVIVGFHEAAQKMMAELSGEHKAGKCWRRGVFEPFRSFRWAGTPSTRP